MGCNCGSSVMSSYRPEISYNINQVSNVIDIEYCNITVDNLIELKDKVLKLQNESVKNIYLGYLQSGLNNNSLICNDLKPMFEHIKNINV